MQNYLICVCFLIPSILFSQNEEENFVVVDNNKTFDLYVAFVYDKNFNGPFDIYKIAEANKDFARIISTFSVQFERAILISDSKLEEMEHNAISLKNDALTIYNLKNIYKIKFNNPTLDRILFLANELEKLSFVRYCDIVSNQPIAPPTDILPTTLNYEMNQMYIQGNPGVNMQFAWDLGFNGQGVKIRDIEYGFNENHEELNSVNVFVANGMTISSNADVSYTEHGTGVIGVLYADKGTYGISGLAYGSSELVLFPEWQQIGYDRLYAINQAINNSSLGDVIIYEMQADGPTNSAIDFVPAEYSQIVWDLTKAATDSGIIIVAAAGNGNQDLDNAWYTSYMARGNSGAIIVGAGTPDVNHDKMSYSTFGSRIDLQGWGNNVFSIGQISGLSGFLIDNDINQSYLTFTGTSAATSMVASCVIVLQSYYYSLHGTYMNNVSILGVLKSTGIPQGTGGNIGPLPNMESAMQAIYDEYLSSNYSFSNKEIIIFPNPVDDVINFNAKKIDIVGARIEITNTLGQIVYQEEKFNNEIITVSDLLQGFYWIKIIKDNLLYSQMFLKK